MPIYLPIYCDFCDNIFDPSINETCPHCDDGDEQDIDYDFSDLNH